MTCPKVVLVVAGDMLVLVAFVAARRCLCKLRCAPLELRQRQAHRREFVLVVKLQSQSWRNHVGGRGRNRGLLQAGWQGRTSCY